MIYTIGHNNSLISHFIGLLNLYSFPDYLEGRCFADLENHD